MIQNFNIYTKDLRSCYTTQLSSVWTITKGLTALGLCLLTNKLLLNPLVNSTSGCCFFT